MKFMAPMIHARTNLGLLMLHNQNAPGQGYAKGLSGGHPRARCPSEAWLDCNDCMQCVMLLEICATGFYSLCCRMHGSRMFQQSQKFRARVTRSWHIAKHAGQKPRLHCFGGVMMAAMCSILFELHFAMMQLKR